MMLLVSDVDGTLVDTAKQLTSGTIAAVRRLQDAGFGFTIISARPMSGIAPIAEALALEALSLGTVLSESGLLIKREAPPRITLVASPDAKRAARDLRAKGPAASSSDPPIVSSAVPKRWRPLTEIPVFHIGTLARRPMMAFEVDEAAEGLLWPLFFRLSDIDRLWEELGDSTTERPPVRAIDLATLVVCLREPAGAHASAHHGAPFPTGARHRPRDARRLSARARRCAGPAARVCASRRARLRRREESTGAGGRGLAASWWRRCTGRGGELNERARGLRTPSNNDHLRRTAVRLDGK